MEYSNGVPNRVRLFNTPNYPKNLARVLAPNMSIVPWEVPPMPRPLPAAGRSKGFIIAGAIGLLAVTLCVLAVRETFCRPGGA